MTTNTETPTIRLTQAIYDVVRIEVGPARAFLSQGKEHHARALTIVRADGLRLELSLFAESESSLDVIRPDRFGMRR